MDSSGKERGVAAHLGRVVRRKHYCAGAGISGRGAGVSGTGAGISGSAVDAAGAAGAVSSTSSCGMAYSSTVVPGLVIRPGGVCGAGCGGQPQNVTASAATRRSGKKDLVRFMVRGSWRWGCFDFRGGFLGDKNKRAENTSKNVTVPVPVSLYQKCRRETIPRSPGVFAQERAGGMSPEASQARFQPCDYDWGGYDLLESDQWEARAGLARNFENLRKQEPQSRLATP